MDFINKSEFNDFLIEKNSKIRKKRKYAIFLFLLNKLKLWFKNTIGKVGYLLMVSLFVMTLGAFVSLLYVLFSGQLLKSLINSEDISQWGFLLQNDWKYIFNILCYFLISGILFGVTTIVIPKQIKKLWWKIFPTEEDIQKEKEDDMQQIELDKNMHITDFQKLT